MKIAIPIENGRLHGHFGGCRQFAVVEVNVKTHAVLHSEILPAPEHQPALFPRWLREQGVRAVIAGGIGHLALAHFAHCGITVRAGAAEASVEALVADFLAGRLTAAPDACDHHDHHHDHQHGGAQDVAGTPSA